MQNNPLYEEQRENSGSTTLAKYHYQYHWALDRALDKLSEQEQYIVFMEAHEDVVFSDSHQDSTNFDFFQIKEISKIQTIKNLYQIKGDEKNSILGKLLLSIHDKSYQEKVRSLCLVVSNGFNFRNILKNNTSLEVYSIHDFNEDTIQDLNTALQNEMLSSNVDISKLQFHHSKLSTDYNSLQSQLIGKITKLMGKLYPNCYFKAEDAYRALLDDLLRKGVNIYDYQDWGDFVQNKGLKSDDILKVLNKNTHNSFDDVRIVFEDISNDLGLEGIKKSIFRKSLQKIHSEIMSLNLYTIDIYKYIYNIILDSKRDNISDMFTIDFIDEIKDNIVENIDIDDVNVIIVYSIIRIFLNEFEESYPT